MQFIATSSLAVQLAQSGPEKPVLLDTRAAAEYAVSHLPNAQWVDSNLEDVTRLNLPDFGQPIVTYCSVGYRSAAIAERLQKAGYTNVANLEGSIFQWVNEGRPVYRNNELVLQVHPYNELWGCLLDQGLHVYEVPANGQNGPR